MTDTSMRGLENISGYDLDLLLEAPVLTCILIGGADGYIDKREMKHAIAFIKKSKDWNEMGEYLSEVTDDFEDKLKVILQRYPFESARRNPMIADDLARLNNTWPQLPLSFAQKFVSMLQALALRVAKSSGGILGVNAVGKQEARYVDLPMLKLPEVNSQ